MPCLIHPAPNHAEEPSPAAEEPLPADQQKYPDEEEHARERRRPLALFAVGLAGLRGRRLRRVLLKIEIPFRLQPLPLDSLHPPFEFIPALIVPREEGSLSECRARLCELSALKRTLSKGLVDRTPDAVLIELGALGPETIDRGARLLKLALFQETPGLLEQ